MKIRLKGDSIRLRLGPSEVAALLEKGTVTESTRLTKTAGLVFTLCSTDAVRAVTVTADGTLVRVDVPASVIRTWGQSDDVTIKADASEDGRPAVLIEKDFECRHDVPGADVYRGLPPG